MFEKEAEGYVNREYDNSYYPDCNFSAKQDAKTAFEDGAEFGYNKANEWHYVKDGDLPKDNKEYLVLYYFNYRGKKETHCGVKDNLHNDFEIHRCYTEQIIAWKEIVLPKDSNK